MRKYLLIAILALSVIGLTGCNANKTNPPKIGPVRDCKNENAIGGLTYPKVSYYIVGRLKTTPLDPNKMPFTIWVFAINKKLHNIPIRLTIDNQQRFTLNYTIDEQPYTMSAAFNKCQANENISLQVQLNSETKGEYLQSLTNIIYQFTVEP